MFPDSHLRPVCSLDSSIYIYISIQNYDSNEKHQQPYGNFLMMSVLVFNTTFNSISWWQVILVEETEEAA